MGSAYDGLPPEAFWRGAVAERDPAALRGLWRPAWPIRPTTRLMTAGGDVSRLLHRGLADLGWNLLDEEPLAARLPAAVAREFQYDCLSARMGPVPTARQIRQVFAEALGRGPERLAVWPRDGRFFDALRPAAEPWGFGSIEALEAARADHLAAIRRLLASAEVLFLTLTHSEAWQDSATGAVFPAPPGTVAGDHDPARFEPVLFDAASIAEDVAAIPALVADINPDLKILLAVSPQPLAATASGRHALAAHAEAKATLITACAHLSRYEGFDYFPAHELLTHPIAAARFLRDGARHIAPDGAEALLRLFLKAQGQALPSPPPAAQPATGAALPEPEEAAEDEAACEEILTGAFRP